MKTYQIVIAVCSLGLTLGWTACGHSEGGETATDGGSTSPDSTVNDSSTIVAPGQADAGVPCTPAAEVDCAKVREAFAPACALHCASLIVCEETTAVALEASCEERKRAGDGRLSSMACLYTNPKSCDDVNRCLRGCDR